MGVQSPLTVTQVLWINLIMDTFAAMALASLPPDKDLIKNKDRDRRAFIIDRSLFLHGISECESRLFFTAFVFLQFWNLFNAKSRYHDTL